ncbi:MAG: ABC transporter permease [Cyclobacteriaceae bacterium]
MLINYLKIAIRAIRKQKLFSAINVFGLSFSLSVCLVIIMLLADQYSYDQFNTQRENIHRINTYDHDIPIIEGMATSAAPLGDALLDQNPAVIARARLIRGFGNGWIKLMQDVNIPISGFFADPEVLDMFQYELMHGNANTALVDPYAVVITQETAEKLFDRTDALGEFIKVGDLGSYQVTGVIRKLDGKSHIKFDALASMASYDALVKKELRSDLKNNWQNRSNTWTYIQTVEDADLNSVETSLASIAVEHYQDDEDGLPEFYLQNIGAINPGPMIGNAIGPGIPMIFVYFLVGMALLIIVSACFNYTNLSLARSLNRAKEVGIRKVFGAVRWQIFFQFLMESVVISILAFGGSLIILQLIKPVFLELNFSQLLDWDLANNTTVYFICFFFSVLVGLIAGIVPSFFHSSVRAMEALKNLSGVKVISRMGMRNFLIVSQFGLALFLIISVKLVYDQMNFMIAQDYGFDSENIVVVKLNGSDPELLKTEYEKYPDIINTSVAGFVPATGTSSTLDVLDGENKRPIHQFAVDRDYVDNMGLSWVAGQNFEKGNEENKLVINEKAVPFLGYDSPFDAVNQTIMLEDSSNYEIIGVLKDYHHETMFSEIKPLVLIHNPDRFSVLQARVHAENYEKAIASLEKGWAAVNPSLKIEYKLMSDEITFFTDLIFGDISKIVTFISLLALIIASLGLMGMVVYSMQMRQKEVSIRKVLGSTHQQLMLVLSKSFVKLLSIAIVISVPVTYFINMMWLDFIAFHVTMGVGTIALGVLTIIAFGGLVIGTQTWRTANTNPAKVLRDE